MHTSIARGNVFCKNQNFPVLPQSSRPVTEEEEDEEEEEEEDDDEKVGTLRATKFCSPGETNVRISPLGLALVIERPVYAGGVFFRPRWSLWGEP